MAVTRCYAARVSAGTTFTINRDGFIVAMWVGNAMLVTLDSGATYTNFVASTDVASDDHIALTNGTGSIAGLRYPVKAGQRIFVTATAAANFAMWVESSS